VLPPPLGPAEAPLMDAFAELSTTRSFGFGLGPIPYTAIDLYARRFGLDERRPVQFDLFRAVIRDLDAIYLDHHARKTTNGNA